ncbi:hypothetical protein D9M70_155260 [compost metagenome]
MEMCHICDFLLQPRVPHLHPFADHDAPKYSILGLKLQEGVARRKPLAAVIRGGDLGICKLVRDVEMDGAGFLQLCCDFKQDLAGEIPTRVQFHRSPGGVAMIQLLLPGSQYRFDIGSHEFM